jgi:hypothetical protein
MESTCLSVKAAVKSRAEALTWCFGSRPRAPPMKIITETSWPELPIVRERPFLRGTLTGREVYYPPQGLKGGQVMTALDRFLASNPNFAEKTYGDAMAIPLSRAFPCEAQ